MQKKPIWHFESVTDTGIDKVPLNSKIYINDIDGAGTPLELTKISLGNLTETSTILDFLDDDTIYNSTIVSNIGELSDVDLSTVPPTTDQILKWDGRLWVPSSPTEGELEKISDDETNYGWSLADRNPDNYGNIGENAVQFSINTNSSTTKGATGKNAFSLGAETTASGDYSIAEGYNSIASGQTSHAGGNGTIALNIHSYVFGTYNVGTSTNTISEVGIGSSDTDRMNAFEIYTNGRITAPQNTIAIIDDDTDGLSGSTLITKDYLDSLNISSTATSRSVEVLSGDGTTTAFTLTNLYVEGSETLVDVYVDGLIKIEGSNTDDYVLSDENTLTFNTAPSNGSSIIIKIIN